MLSPGFRFLLHHPQGELGAKDTPCSARAVVAAAAVMGTNSHGGRGNRGRGRRGRGGGGQQRWWDPVWRAQRLKQIHTEEEELDEKEWLERMEKLKSQDAEREIVIKRNFGHSGAKTLERMANQQELYFHVYNKGRNTVLVVSKDPLPNYRADLDEKHGSREREITLSCETESRVKSTLASFRTASSKNTFFSGCKTSNCNPSSSSTTISFRADQGHEQSATVDRLKVSLELKKQEQKLQASFAAKAMRNVREKLPAFKMRNDFLKAVAGNQVLVVSGETGCGKTTQLPQFILEEEIDAGRGADCNIICTQPRRISAISVSARVAAERGENLGETVGYQIRMESKLSARTRLMFCTTGVLLRRLVQDGHLTGVSHVLVDEIHERGMNEDFLLIILRDLLPRRPDLHILLMSATINPQLFSAYFDKAPVLHIPGFSYPVRQWFLEDVLEGSHYAISGDNSSNSTGGRWRKGLEKKKDPLMMHFEDIDIQKEFRNYSYTTQHSLSAWNGDQIDLDLVEATIEFICRQENDGAVLVFLTGWDDISKLLGKIKINRFLGNSSKFLILPLHGSMPTVNQKQIFQSPPEGMRKIVLATNIAETSITINDIIHVVDCGKAKETSYDALNKLACLTPSWISKASAHQRKGRAGRVSPGFCYHLYPKVIHEAMPEYQLPEILRTPLQELCLQIKNLQVESISGFLSKALQPPEQLAVQNAIDLLKTIGALDKEEELTALGKHLATLPLDPKVGKMLLMGAVFECLDPALTIAAALAYRDPFLLPIDKKEAADAARKRFAGDTCSDHFALLRAFEEWQVAKCNGRDRQFCWQNFLSAPTLQMMEEMRYQFLDLLSDIGFLRKSRDTQACNKYSGDLELVRAVLCAGLFPNVVQCKQRGKRTAFFTKEDGKVEPHPSSVNARVNYFPQPWLVYSDKVKTTGIYIRDSSNVSDYALLMFGGQLDSKLQGGLEMLGGYLHFSASEDTIQLIQELRKALDALLWNKIEQPQLDIHSEGMGVVNAAIELLHTGANLRCQSQKNASQRYGKKFRR